MARARSRLAASPRSTRSKSKRILEIPGILPIVSQQATVMLNSTKKQPKKSFLRGKTFFGCFDRSHC
jgi:hypothetical protein